MKTNLTIRPANVEDRDFMIGLVPRFVEFSCPPGREPAQVIDAIAQELYQVASTPNDSTILIAEDLDGRRLGFIYLQTATDPFTHERHGHIADIAVTSVDEGQGVGQALMEVAEDWARNKGYRLLTLRAIAGNTRVRSFYQRLGYEEDMVKYITILN